MTRLLAHLVNAAAWPLVKALDVGDWLMRTQLDDHVCWWTNVTAGEDE